MKGLIIVLESETISSTMRLNTYKIRLALLLSFITLSWLTSSCFVNGLFNGHGQNEVPHAIHELVDLLEDMSNQDIPDIDNTVVEVWNNLKQDYIEKHNLDPESMNDAAREALALHHDLSRESNLDILTQIAVEAMLETTGDPYAYFLTPEQYELYSQNMDGTFSGIGATVDLIDSQLTIISPIKNSPAEIAGIEPGDVILEVDNISTVGWSVRESVMRIRGPEGSNVRLLVKHKSSSEPVVIDIVRSTIEIPSVIAEVLPQDIVYIEIGTFADNTDELLAEIMSEPQVAGSNGIIIDLRNNLGGLLSSTINVTSQFIKSGLVLYSVDSNNNRIDYQVNEDLHVTDLPIAVIVNQYSASGSEVMAGALQDHERAILIGTQTFGKGSVNLPKILKNGSGMYFTVGRWYSPNGHIIEGQGLTPNIIVDRADNGSDSDKDKQLELAIDYLQGQFSNDSR